MQLHLTTSEHNLLVQILEERYRELLKEIGHTDTHSFKLVLREKETLLESILEKLGALEPTVP